MITAEDLTNSELIEHIEQLRSAAYLNLSQIHTEWLKALEDEANHRKLKLP